MIKKMCLAESNDFRCLIMKWSEIFVFNGHQNAIECYL